MQIIFKTYLKIYILKIDLKHFRFQTKFCSTKHYKIFLKNFSQNYFRK